MYALAFLLCPLSVAAWTLIFYQYCVATNTKKSPGNTEVFYTKKCVTRRFSVVVGGRLRDTTSYLFPLDFVSLFGLNGVLINGMKRHVPMGIHLFRQS